MTPTAACTAFLKDRRLAVGTLAEVVAALAADPAGRAAQVFEDATGDLVKLGRPAEVARALAPPSPPAPVQPLAARFDLLPRHVVWLEAQPGGPSAAVRRLVEAARRDGTGRPRQARDAAYRFLSMMAGDRPGFEDACRALYAGDATRFAAATADWPADIAAYARALAGEGLA